MDDLQKYQFDTIIIAIYDSRTAEGIYDNLIGKYGVDRSKIYWEKPMSLYEYGVSVGMFI